MRFIRSGNLETRNKISKYQNWKKVGTVPSTKDRVANTKQGLF